MNNMMQYTMRERELRDSGSIANSKICFEVRATTLRLRLHTEGFLLCPHRTSHTGNLHRGITTLHLEYTTPLSNTTTSTQEVRHKVKTTITSTQEGWLQSQITITSHKRDKAQSQTTITSTQKGIRAQS